MQAVPYRGHELLQHERSYGASRWMMLMLPIILAGASVAIAWAILNGKLPGFLWVSVAIMAPLALLVLKVNSFPAFRATNWVLQHQRDTLYVHLRNYRNAYGEDDGATIIVLPLREVASVGEHKELFCNRKGNKQTNWSEQRLEIRLKEVISEEVQAALQAEQSRRPPAKGIIRLGSYYPSPVSMPDERTLRILWSGRYDVVAPRLKRALEDLGALVQIHEPVVIDRRNIGTMNSQELDKLILDLCGAGDRLEAIKLLTQQRGYTLKAAKEFVDALG